ncbi:unnamed protein product [Cuscuta epithymum]|uniref:Uncharacterized protein n=1 Tax=Cuscuta epithymum TaxID=186058 RepID=A0AAV0FL60_9ASTE|nr:unnamed protein product [Cuscuta epithymum]
MEAGSTLGKKKKRRKDEKPDGFIFFHFSTFCIEFMIFGFRCGHWRRTRRALQMDLCAQVVGKSWWSTMIPCHLQQKMKEFFLKLSRFERFDEICIRKNIACYNTSHVDSVLVYNMTIP